MDKKLAQAVAEKVIKYLFSDATGKPIDRLMIVYGGQNFKNPGWGRESIRGEIVKQILRAAQPARAADASPRTAQEEIDLLGEQLAANHAKLQKALRR